jgi:hypothetical protein
MPLKINDLMDDYFLEVLRNNASTVKMNVFLIGYKQDQGIRACGGRSGAELGAQVFREMLYERHSVMA